MIEINLGHLRTNRINEIPIMETFGIIGMTFGIMALGIAVKTAKELADMKKELEASGMLKPKG